MKDKIHQQSGTEYQIRINGAPVAWYPYFDKYTLAEYAKVCNDNAGEYVDIVSVRTEILLNQGSYHQMKLHFSQA